MTLLEETCLPSLTRSVGQCCPDTPAGNPSRIWSSMVVDGRSARQTVWISRFTRHLITPDVPAGSRFASMDDPIRKIRHGNLAGTSAYAPISKGPVSLTEN
jgi:hypothetical protein